MYRLTKDQVRQIYEIVPEKGFEAAIEETGLRPKVVRYVLDELNKRGVYVESMLERQINEIAGAILKEVGTDISTIEIKEIIETVFIDDELMISIADAVYRRIKDI